MAVVLVFIAFLDNMSQQPLISPYANSLGASTLMVGLIVGIYSISNIVGNIFSPILISRSGLKDTLTIGFIVVSLSLFFYTVLQTPRQMLLLRVIHGLAGGIIVPCIFTYISYGKSQDQRMSHVGRVIGLAALIGPAVSSMLANRSYQIPFLILAIIFMGGIFIVRRLAQPIQSNTKVNFSGVVKNRGLQVAYVAAFCLLFAKGMLAFWFPLQLVTAGFPLSYVGIFFSIFAVVAIAVMRLAAAKAKDTPILVIASGFLILNIAMVILSLSTYLPLITIGMIVYGLGFGCIFPAMNLLIVKETSEAERASAFAIFHGFFSLGVFVAPIIGALTAQYLSPFLSVVLLVIGCSLYFIKLGVGEHVYQEI